MLTDWISAIDQSALAAALRGSIWVYPIINAAHILGLALLLGAMLVLDIRLLVQARGLPPAPLAGVLLPAARGGFALALGSGLLLFVARAADYAFNPLFQLKLGLIALALLNVWLAHRLAFWRQIDDHAEAAGDHAGASRAAARSIPTSVRVTAAISLLTWTTVMIIGRLLGYR